MTKSSVDRKRSRYGEKYTLRFHKKTKTYELSIHETPMLIAKFVETDGDLAMRLFELLEGNYKGMEILFNENNVLKEEIGKFKEWEKYIGDAKREDLDRVFKMSIYEIAEAFEYYQKRIKELEENDC